MIKFFKKKGKKRIFILVFLLISVTSLSSCSTFIEDNLTGSDVRDDFGFISSSKDNSSKENENLEEELDKPIKPSKDEEVIKPEKKPIDVKGTNCIDSAKEYAVNRQDVEDMINGSYNGPLVNEKIVFLTFDDGPSNNTLEILNILKQYSIHGTFFALGSSVESKPEYLKEIYYSGNAIGNHSYSHNYKNLYPGNKISVENYMAEYEKTENLMKSILGNDFSTNLIRMPGGEMSRAYYNDENLKSLKDRFKKEGIASVDWNALNGDAENKNYSVNEMIEYVKKTSAGKNHVVVLMHDTEKKYLTVRALPEIIEYFKAEGYSFKIIS